MIQPIPAIDLKDGKCVRLRQGRAEDATVYSDDPVSMARHWEDEGARILHVVDLDGAFQGHPVHQDVVARIAEAINIPVELGGGLRTDADIELMLKAGVSRVVIGTRAWSQPGQLEGLVRRFGEKLAVGIDARNGNVQVKGWTETTALQAVTLASKVDSLGVKYIIYTDTATDGMMTGVNVKAVGEICRAVSCSVIASGGVSSADDMKSLASLGCANLVGAIVGKALYEGRVNLRMLEV